MAKQPLRLLLAEDSEDDAVLLLHYLKKDHWEIERFQRVDNPDSMRAALLERRWDLVITDHNMPSFDSEDALALIRRYDSDLPIIIVSGSIDEDFAVMMMKNGAADYIMKDNLIRLGAAIERELQEAKSRAARRQAEDELQHIAYHDPLTNLKNRREFEQVLSEALHSALHENQTHALLYLDLDQFKVINDTCGHMAGDQLIRQISALLQGQVRGSDMLARLGGDEFGVILHDCALGGAELLADKLRESVENSKFIWETHPFSTTVSIGLVDITRENRSVDEVLSNADMACFAAKKAGRNRVHVYRSGDDALATQRHEMQWISRINSALDEERLMLYQQPIVSLNGENDRAHREILLRMREKSGEIVLPGAFIPAAEHYNQMPRLDRWVVNAVFTYLAKQTGNSTENGLHFINLSGASLSDRGFFRFIAQRLEQLGIDAGSVCFEVTETAAINNLDSAISFIHEIREMGCSFALDDFGTGLSSFSYLKSLPVDFIKIDGSFVSQLDEDEMSRAIVEAINNIGHVAGLKTIAEFVESEEVFSLLNSMGVDYAQGYAICKPGPFV